MDAGHTFEGIVAAMNRTPAKFLGPKRPGRAKRGPGVSRLAFAVIAAALCRPAALALCLAIGLVGTAWSAPGSLWRAMDDGAELRLIPEAAAEVVARLQAGDRLIEFERRADWLRVAPLGEVGSEGWIREARLLPVPQTAGPVLEPGHLTPSDGSGLVGPDTDERGALRHDDLADGLATYRVEVGGTPGLDIVADCRLVTPYGDDKTRRIRRLSPFALAFEAGALSCRLRKRDSFGRLQARLFENGILIAAHGTRAAFNHVRLRSHGPWGAAGSRRGTTPLVTFPNLQKNKKIVPPLTRTVVPRL